MTSRARRGEAPKLPQQPEDQSGGEAFPRTDNSANQRGRQQERQQQQQRQRSGTQESGRHQRFVLADPVAFSYLEEDPSVVILERARYLEGYQCYVVEQWACSRSHPTFVVIAYTGDAANRIKVGVLSVPADESSWSPRLKVYFRTLAQYHARRRETPLGTVLVTNLSGFPSSLTLINVPDGDVRKHREDFVVNENLKRLGCSGRVGMSIAAPSPAAEAKFHQLYRTSEKIELYKSVIELVKLCQAALVLFDILKPEYADGLLCDVTEKAVNDWWTEFGYDYFKTEPSDGILGPTTVAALLGTLLGARSRLHVLNAPVSKDVFDIEATKNGIQNFQKSQHLRKTRRFDRQTLDSLHRATAKQASTEGWMVPRAVKSTVAELSGKGGEMVMDMVGRERAALAEIETTDIERFAQLVRGERAKWLWQGRARKRTTRDLFDEHPGQVTQKVDEDFGLANASDAQQQRDDRAVPDGKSKQPYQKHTRSLPTETADPRQTVLKRAKGRLRGATSSKKGQHQKVPNDAYHGVNTNRSYESFNSARSEPLTPAETPIEPPDNIFDERSQEAPQFGNTSRREDSRLRGLAPRLANRLGSGDMDSPQAVGGMTNRSHREDERPIDLGGLDRRALNIVNTEMSVAEDVVGETDMSQFSPDQRPAQRMGALLLRTESYSKFVEDGIERGSRQRWPRHISFSAVEDAIHGTNESCSGRNSPHRPDKEAEQAALPLEPGEDLVDRPQVTLMNEKVMESRQRALREELALIGRSTGNWLLGQVGEVALLDSTAAQDADQLEQLYAPRKEEQHALASGSQEVLKEEKARLAESIRDLETLGQRVEYEIEGLRGKVEDMENSVGDFEKQVLFVEDRVKELVKGQEMQQKSTAETVVASRSDETWSSWVKSIFLKAPSRQDVTDAVSEAIRTTQVKAETAVREASKASPLTDAPSSSEVSLQGGSPQYLATA